MTLISDIGFVNPAVAEQFAIQERMSSMVSHYSCKGNLRKSIDLPASLKNCFYFSKQVQPAFWWGYFLSFKRQKNLSAFVGYFKFSFLSELNCELSRKKDFFRLMIRFCDIKFIISNYSTSLEYWLCMLMLK